MKTIFTPEVRKELVTRVNSLTPGAERKWGKMSVDQGLHHINGAFKLYLGEIKAPYHGKPLKALIFRLVTFSPILIPPEKGRTAPALVAAAEYDLNAEKAEFPKLLERVAAQQGMQEWPIHALFGKLSAAQYGKLGYKHTDHHLRQFGA